MDNNNITTYAIYLHQEIESLRHDRMIIDLVGIGPCPPITPQTQLDHISIALGGDTKLGQPYTLLYPVDRKITPMLLNRLTVYEGTDCDMQLFKSQLHYIKADTTNICSVQAVSSITFVSQNDITDCMKKAIKEILSDYEHR